MGCVCHKFTLDEVVSLLAQAQRCQCAFDPKAEVDGASPARQPMAGRKAIGFGLPVWRRTSGAIQVSRGNPVARCHRGFASSGSTFLTSFFVAPVLPVCRCRNYLNAPRFELLRPVSDSRGKSRLKTSNQKATKDVATTNVGRELPLRPIGAQRLDMWGMKFNQRSRKSKAENKIE